MTSRTWTSLWTLALTCLGGLMATGASYAEDEPGKRLGAARHAVLQRAADEDGDRHERILRDVAARRTADPTGDDEVARQFRMGHQGQAVVHANLDRLNDRKGDQRVQAVARLNRSARFAADLRRTRDLRGDQPVLTAYKDYRIRHGNLDREIYRIAQDGWNERRQQYREERDPRSGSERLETDEDSVRRDERTADRIEEREMGREERGERGFDAADVDPDRELEREEDRLEEEAEKAAERDEAQGDRDLDREQEIDEAQEDRETERLINNEEGGALEDPLDSDE
ncbi:MAG: hypothetical protein KDD82_12545 [Planctomycetes bacterium]|nr:hypothetical protein [Planctomycetota bacterium]